MKKSQLKEPGSYYYESKSWYESCPKTLPETPKFKIEILSRRMTHSEILKEYAIIPYASYAEAATVVASLIPDLKNNYKSRIVYFTENNATYRFIAWRNDDGQLGLGVNEIRLDDEFAPEYGVAFGNGHFDTSRSFDSSDTLTLESAIKMVVDAGYKVECERCGNKK